MEFKDITLEDKKLFDDYFKKYPQISSEFTFTNLFAWRKGKEYRYAIMDDHLVIRSKENVFFKPIGKDPARIIKKIFSEIEGASFERIEKSVAEQLKDQFKVTEQRGMFDYVYSIKELVELKGGAYTEKRNLISQCEKHDPTTCLLNMDTLESFEKMQERWCKERDCDDESLQQENDAVLDVLENFKSLGVFGICVWMDGEMQGFAICEKLNEDTYVEHFEKGNIKYPGIYQYVLHEFSKIIPKNFRYLNREQDIDIPGLRKAKLSYNPASMVEKYIIEKKIS